MEYAQTLGGLLALLVAGDFLVRGAVNLSLRLGIPTLIVSLTVVAFGTSAPELLVSLRAVADNAPGIAIGNVVGSNTANILLVLGLAAAISGLNAGASGTRKNYVYMLISAAMFAVACFLGPITWISGMFLLAALAAFLTDALLDAKAHRSAADLAQDDLEGADPGMKRRWIAFYLVAGLVGPPLGAELLVQGAATIARELGMREAVIGLTLVALGTSLPELATTVIAALKRNADVALGNVIGSNLFNVLAIIGIASFVGPISVDPGILAFDLWVMLAASLILAPFIFRGLRMGRAVGLGLIALYVAYVLALVV